MSELERDIEKRLVKKVRDELSGRAYKFVSPENDGVPDRIVCLPDGSVWFVELKTDEGKLTKLQRVQIERLSGLGQHVCVLCGRHQVDEFINMQKIRLRFVLRKRV